MASTQRCLSKGNNKYLYLNDEDLDDNAILSIKHDFYEMVSEYYTKNLASNNVCLESVGSIMKIVISNEVAPDYITKISGWDETQSCFEIKVEDCIIEKRNGKNHLFHSASGIIRELIPWETSFEVVWQTHLENDHPEPPKLKEVLDAKYIYHTYVTECINAVCPVCVSREKPNARISLYLVYMGGNGDFSFRYVMVYQDLLTNFKQLRPICTELMQKDITLELLQIFTDFGPPIYIEISEIAFEEPIDAVMGLLQFFKYTVNKVKKDSTKNESILSLLTEWMSETHCLNWGVGCLMMQWKLNNEVGKDGKTSFAKVFAPDVEGKTAAKRKHYRTQDLNMALEKASKSLTSLEDNNEIIIKEQFSLKIESQSPKEKSDTQNSASESEDDYYLSKFLLGKPGPSNQSDIDLLDSQSSSNSVRINDPLKFEPDSDDDDDL